MEPLSDCGRIGQTYKERDISDCFYYPSTMSHHAALTQLLSANAQWAKDVERLEPGFFKESAKGQTPQTLWIGCADSRVPESVITGAKPGDIFVNRNVGNQVNLDDDNMLAVLTYAVEHLGVEHVVVCGHTECGAAAACFGASSSFVPGQAPVTIPVDPADAPLNRWLAPLTTLAASLEISSAPANEALPLLIQENVKAQVNNLCRTEVIAKAWANGKSPKGKEVWVHGWVYDVSTGTIRDLGISRGPK
ncbi:carbonic anhydrase [Lentinula detonsa]|uniref:Carbonic anhydrase n=2 Tax=Lentinula detonsa TaxID=2804962 RepID=A0A9W8TYA1_9AGAR|nr:carbonic anhydrase [Lentinula detonsa]